MTLHALDGHSPSLPAGFSFVAESATVIGKVRLGEDASVWFGSVVRGDNEPITIGARSNVQDLCVLHSDPGFPLVVGMNCTIGHRATLHGCSVGEGTLVGMSATILNGARIGKHCIIGAGALITEGQEIPDGVLVLGVPGRVDRALTEDEIVRLKQSADHYVANARRFAAGLTKFEG